MSVSGQQATALELFEYLFAHDSGYLCISTMKHGDKHSFRDMYFEWPKQLEEALNYIDKTYGSLNVWFCVNILSVPKRLKENCIPQNLVWADLDACRPDMLAIPPQCVIESSPRRYQAIWKLDQKVDPLIATDYSKRIAYQYADLGVDKSGHDLTQLLRVPGTFNFKYELGADIPQVNLLVKRDEMLPVVLFDRLPQAEEFIDIPDLDMPDIQTLASPQEIIYRYQDQLKDQAPAFARYYSDEPNEDWSKSLWRLLNSCVEVGMTAEETFAIALSSKCNKYARDNRPTSHLWREVLKAERSHKSILSLVQEIKPFVMPALLHSDEYALTGNTIIHDYKEWATEATDAVPEYHEISCAILLSALMAAGLRLEMSHSTLVPNLWALLLGDSTLTRKTTAMELTMGFISDIDADMIVATDASPEGIMTVLNQRPKMTSIFYRDEITGFLSAIQQKDYLSSMPEILTKLYDVPKHYKRQLRKESINVTEPVFIFFGGGIREKTFFLINEEYFTSGFVARYLVVNGYVDRDRIRRTGPPDKKMNVERRTELLQTFQHLHSTYTDNYTTIDIGEGMEGMPTKTLIHADLTDEAWSRYQEMEQILEDAGDASPFREKALPTFVRMSFSLLKLAVLLAAARQEPNQEKRIIVEKLDILEAGFFIERWGVHMVDLIRNSGHTHDESRVQSVYRQIERNPGIMRSQVMTYHRLNARQMDVLEETLEQRMMIQVSKKGKSRVYWPIGR